MGSPEIITRVKELTTPVQGEGDVSYALVVPANKGSYEPKWITGINDFKQQYTPNGVFEAGCSSTMYAVKKYCEAGDIQLLVVRPNTGALMSGIKVIDAEPSINFTALKSSGAVQLGDCITFNNNSYFCKVATTVPTATTVAEIEASDWLDNFVQVEASGTVVQNLISFGANTSFKCGTTLYFAEDPNNAVVTTSEEITFPAYYAVLPNSTLEDNNVIFGWYANSADEGWKFGYALYQANPASGQAPFTEVYPVVLSGDNTFVLPKDIVCGASSFWTASDESIEVQYDLNADIKLQINVESYDALEATGFFGALPEPYNEVPIGTGIWYGGAPYICIQKNTSAIVPADVTASWINYYFNQVGSLTSSNYQPWEVGVNDISEYTQADDELFTLYSANGGAWGNALSFTLVNYEDDPDEIEVEGCFKLTFFNNGNETESYIVSRKEGLLDANGNSMYIQDVINERSAEWRVKDSALPDSVLPLTLLNPVFLGGGANQAVGQPANPSPSVNDSIMIKALNLMADESVYPLFAVGDGGYATENYAKAIQAFVDARKGTKGVVCVPHSSVKAATMAQAYSNIEQYNVNLAISDSKMRIEEYWGMEFDADTGKQVAIPPDGMYIRNEALTKRNEGLYFPNAGWQNGAVNVDLINKWSKGYRDLLEKIKVNYCRYERARGGAIFSQNTMLKRPSYLQDDTHEKVLLDMIPKHIDILESYLLRLAETGVFNQIEHDMNASMELVQNNHGCVWYAVTCSQVNNSTAQLDSGEVNVWVEYQPTPVIKKIILTYGLTNQSVRLIDVQA